MADVSARAMIFKIFLRLTQYFNCLHFVSGYPVEPLDLHPSIRHLDCLYDMLTLTDKTVHGYSLGTERIEDSMEMVRLAGGFSEAEFTATPRNVHQYQFHLAFET